MLADLTGQICGPAVGQVVTSWVQPSAGHLQVVFTSDGKNCCQAGTPNNCSALGCPAYPDVRYASVTVGAYEYRRYQAGAQPFWTPLRFPGQYYDPSIGRYLSPEPMLTDPLYVVERALEGRSSPIYAYAGNNPIMFTDPDGLEVKNESDREIIIKPEGDGTVVIIDADGEKREIEVKAGDAVTLAPGETYAGSQDGLADPEMRGGVVMKTVNGIDATVKADGTVELSLNPSLSTAQAAKAVVKQALGGGWQHGVWNQNLNRQGDTGWNAIFQQSLRNGYVVRRWP